ncbi:ATP-binding cassette domain-containing protein [Bradyrhizobium zhanjiangense]|uniref:ATP-binding cassette domain-containing protein n=2 Tax=Bradyrhizobium zhanjiangense TaxID=1325107 RepID=A0ABY0DTZ5_9BRAD|nr:ATP-binding cassette domain-containing protein [Bradyrhizobium zhanjiangense]
MVLGKCLYGLVLRGVPRPEGETRALALLKSPVSAMIFLTKPKALSHGMRQRCALARTFALNSPIFMMNEPFGARACGAPQKA